MSGFSLDAFILIFMFLATYISEIITAWQHWLAPTLSVGILGVVIIACLMYFKYHGWRMKWWWGVFGLLALLMTQSFTVLILADNYRQWALTDHFWYRSTVENAVWIAQCVLVNGAGLCVLWVFLPGLKGEQQPKLKGMKVIVVACCFMWTFVVGGLSMNEKKMDWPRRFPKVLHQQRLTNDEVFLLGHYMTRDEELSNQTQEVKTDVYTLTRLNKGHWFLHQSVGEVRPDWNAQDYHWAGQVVDHRGIYLSDDEKIVLVVNGAQSFLFNREGKLLHQASLWTLPRGEVDEHYDEIHKKGDIAAITVMKTPIEVPLVIYYFQTDTNDIPIDISNGGHQVLFLMMMIDRHGFTKSHLVREDFLPMFKGVRVKLDYRAVK